MATFILVFVFFAAYPQQDTTKTKKEIRKGKREIKKNEPPHKGSFYTTPLPVIGQNPAWGFMYGAAVSKVGLWAIHPQQKFPLCC